MSAGLDRLSFDILNGKMTVAADALVEDRQVTSAVAKTGMQAERWKDERAKEHTNHGRRRRVFLTAASGALTLAGFIVHAALAGGLTAALGS